MSKEIKNKCVNALYAGLKFGNYNNPEKNTVLKYELEYIISGKDILFVTNHTIKI